MRKLPPYMSSAINLHHVSRSKYHTHHPVISDASFLLHHSTALLCQGSQTRQAKENKAQSIRKSG